MSAFSRYLNLILIISTLSLTGCGSSGQDLIEVTPPEPQQDLTTYLQSQGFSGAAYIAVDGEVLLDAGVGPASKSQQTDNTPDTRFRIGSVTKQLTAAAILILQERGMLTLDDPVATHLPDFPRGDTITLRHLLTHTSGLQNYTALSPFLQQQQTFKTPQQLMATFEDLPLDFTPGSAFSYSNSGYVVLGAVIEALSGMPYAAFMQDNIFQPLAMDATYYGENQPKDEREATGYQQNGETAPLLDMSLPYAAGALVSTTGDLAKWDRALYGYTLLSEASTTMMFTPELNNYALGWQLTRWQDEGELVQQHGGGINGFSALMARFSESKKVIVLLSNIEGYPLQTLALHLNQQVSDDN